jgi:CDP-glycerol glycerophosphotransferase (TagB/SpsB family)
MTAGVIDSLKTKYGARENFEFQDRMEESDTLFRSDILISDWSAMAIEYALGLEKPVLFVDLPRRVRNPDWQALGIEPQEAAFRELAGDIVSPQHLEQAPERIARLLENQVDFRQRMVTLRSRMVFNIGNSIEKGAREIVRLADKKAVERQAREQADDR